MKRIVLFMVMVSMVCIASYAQKAAEGTKVLVAYFSATGNTEKAAQQVASIVSGDLHKIQPEKSYTSADLNWRDVTDKFAKAGFHATKSDFVDAPLIDELAVAIECKLKDYDPDTCILRGEIVNVSVDERVLDENGKVNVAKAAPIIFDPFNNDYLRVGEKVGNAFSDGKQLK